MMGLSRIPWARGPCASWPVEASRPVPKNCSQLRLVSVRAAWATPLSRELYCERESRTHHQMTRKPTEGQQHKNAVQN